MSFAYFVKNWVVFFLLTHRNCLSSLDRNPLSDVSIHLLPAFGLTIYSLDEEKFLILIKSKLLIFCVCGVFVGVRVCSFPTYMYKQ